MTSRTRRPGTGVSARRLAAPGKHFHARGHGVEQVQAGFAGLQSSKGRLHGIVARCEILQLVDVIVEADDRGFRFRPHDLFGEENSGLAKLRKERIDARTRFDHDHQRDRIAADIEVSDFLRHAVVGDEEILLHPDS